MFVLIYSTFMQVFTRYVLNSSWPWTEEMARYSFIWMNMVGAAAGLRKGTLVAVDILPNALKGNAKRALQFTIFALMFVGALVLTVYGMQLLLRVGGSPSVVMRFPMGYIHAAMPFGGFGMMVASLTGALESLIEPVKGGEA